MRKSKDHNFQNPNLFFYYETPSVLFSMKDNPCQEKSFIIRAVLILINDAEVQDKVVLSLD